MEENKNSKVTPVGLLVAIGIIYGDIGTSPLYAMNSIVGSTAVDKTLVFGAISCIFWTLTLQTTIKYVVLTLQADNHGEGGIFSLFTILKSNYRYLTMFAIVGGSAMLADGIITPPISVSSAVEGLRIVYPHLKTLPIVIGILVFLFAIQALGTDKVGKGFGPIMCLWFSMIGVFGFLSILKNPSVLVAVNPVYGFRLLVNHPGGVWLLGSVFLCTTGAEALYSDMGHCGKQNVRVSWGIVKICLLLNYFGQAAWLMEKQGKPIHINPFYGILPEWFLMAGIIISTIATIIASQAVITGSYTLISEAIKLGLWPRTKIVYPSNSKGQLYVPGMNILLAICCILVTLFFKKSTNMEAAYGLTITVTMLMTTILLGFYLHMKKMPVYIIGLLVLFYGCIELSFLTANLRKFPHGGYVSVLITFILTSVMWIWNEARKIETRLIEFVDLEPLIPRLCTLSKDETVPKYGTHLIYMTGAHDPQKIEQKIIYSILEQKPKRADIYWFIHVETTNEPFTREFRVNILAPEDVIHITFRLGFRMEQTIGIYLRHVIKELVKNKEVDVTSRYQSLNKENVIGDFTFVVMKKFLSYENNLPWNERIILWIHFMILKISQSQKEWFGIDLNHLVVEYMPLVLNPVKDVTMERIK